MYSGTNRQLFTRYALPQMIGLLFNSVYMIVDGVFIGHKLGTDSMAAAAARKEGKDCDLLARLGSDPAFPLSREEIDALLDPQAFIGRAPEQVDAFLQEIQPLLSGAAEMEEVGL